MVSAERFGNMPTAQQLLSTSLSNLEHAKEKAGIYGTQWHSNGLPFADVASASAVAS
jgi:hypothetical protein